MLAASVGVVATAPPQSGGSDDVLCPSGTPRPFSSSPLSSSSSLDEELNGDAMTRSSGSPAALNGLLYGGGVDDLSTAPFDVDAALSYDDGADLLTQLHRAKSCVDVLRRHLAVERDKVAALTRAVEDERGNVRRLRAAVAKERDLKREYLAELQVYRTGGNRTTSVANGTKRSTVYRSTASLHSDGRSCNSSSGGSAGPSPSPSRFNHQHHFYSPSSGPVGGGAKRPPPRTSVPTNGSPAPRRPSAPSGLSNSVYGTLTGAAPSPAHRGAPHSGGLLTPASKKWSSSSDFHSPFGSVSSASHHSAMPNRKTPSGSMMSLARPKRVSAHASPTSPLGVKSAAQRYNSLRDVSYNEEEGNVRFYLRGRPIQVYVPTAEMEGFEVARPIPAPDKTLKLDWVYGYRGKDCRSNLYLLPTGELVYFVAAVAVLYNVEEMTQRHYLGHTDDIKCLALHPSKLLVATGQTAGHDRKDARPHVRIWDSVSLQTLHVIGVGEFERSVGCLSFSGADGGGLLCAVDEAPDHNISIWDWQRGERGHKLVETKCSAERVLSAEFHPVDKNVIVTCGKSHCAFWTLEPNGTLSKKNGLFERDKPKYVTCLAFDDNGNVVTGDSNGNIIVWARGGNTIEKIYRGAHEGGVFSICFLQNGTFVSGGGKDGVLREWDSNSHEPTGRELEIPEPYGPVRTITSGKAGTVVVGTTRNSVVRGSFDGAVESCIAGHTDEVWALAAHPHQGQFLTGAHDKVLRMWDSMSHSVVWAKDMEDGVQSACFSPDGSTIVAGLTSGRWVAMDAETREPRAGGTDGNEPIQVVKFSPDGSLLALGSRDNFVYIYEVTEEFSKYSRIGRCSGHSSFISHLDWSEDGVNLQTTSGDYELLYWNASVCRQIPQSSQLRDVAWATQTCVLGSSVLGIWPTGADGTDVNACSRSRSKDLLAVGDDFGRVRLLSHPTSSVKASANVGLGHSSHVCGVTFLVEDSRLISIGGRDMSVMQWLLE